MTFAEPWKRLVAAIIDSIALSILMIPLIFLTIGTSIFSIANASETLSEDEAAMMVISMMGKFVGIWFLIIVLQWLYFALLESSKHQATLGKMALKIKVTNLEGERISFINATGRFFGKMISGMIMYVGYIMILFTDKKQGLHDMMASTLVLEAGEEYQNYMDEEEEF